MAEDTEDILKDYLGTELYLEAVEGLGVNEERLLKVYHETGNNPKQFEKAVAEAVDSNQIQETVASIEKNIENLEEQLENLRGMKQGVFLDKIREVSEDQ